MLTTRGLTKRFPGIVAVDHVDLNIAAGEIVALLGQNGAGKSTLIQILAGVHPVGTFDGEITLAGRPFAPASVAQAEAAGVVLIPQEVNVLPERTVAQNMFLNAEPRHWGLIDHPRLLALAGKVLRDFDVQVDPEAPMGSLDLATQQLVVIARALSKHAQVLILDEPTAALTEHEGERLFRYMRALSARGVACILVSHRLAEVFAIASRILVMRDGRLRGVYQTSDTSHDAIVAEMIGRDVEPVIRSTEPSLGPVALDVQHLTVRDHDRRRTRVSDLCFKVHRGEIVGLFGLLGAGWAEVADALFGSWRGRVDGEVRVHGQPVSIRAPGDALRAGIGLLAQDRRATLMPDASIADNLVLASLRAISPGYLGLLDDATRRRLAGTYRDRLQIRAPSIDTSRPLASRRIARAVAGRPDPRRRRGRASRDQPSVAAAG